ncbi:MAG TPA: carotenoid oxygenase family protein [Cytophagaceae bacterium]|nr:carotenoid oxygenase family protein [Cytophagaceae bacterium]
MDSLKSYQYANRKEVSFALKVKEGKIPEDIYGVIYLTSMCGTLNSGGLPIPRRHPGDSYNNPEFGTPLLAGDGMMFKIDFNQQGEVNIKTKIAKPPCYYADLATDRINSPKLDKKFQHYGFKNAGMTRACLQLGFRNELSVAVIPFQFEGDKHPRMLATFDAGRPWEYNTETLELITPLEEYSRWLKGTPPGLKFPFYIVQNSAHPSFDPRTKEFFTVNYTQKKSTGYQIAFFFLLLEHRDEIRQHLEKQASIFEKIRYSFQHSGLIQEIITDLKILFDKTHRHEYFHASIKNILKKHNVDPDEFERQMNGDDDSPNQVFLLKWNGKQEPLKRWRVVDENGDDLVIEECMHQTALTEDYILLSDSSFKFSADLLVNNPFPDSPSIDRLIRDLLNKKSPMDMKLFMVKRSELTDDATVVHAKQIALPEDCIHFVANYANPNNEITLYTINNNSVCVSEWIREYDTLKISGDPVYDEIIGLPAVSAMDVNSLSQYIINTDTGGLKRLDCWDTGGAPGHVAGPHTWELCLLTHRDMISPKHVVEELKDLFVFSAGLNSQRLTTFMYDLFKDTPNKKIPPNEVLKYTEAGVKQSLFRLHTDGMKIKDSYMPDFNSEIRSLQFIPRRTPKPGVPESMDGYIVCIMMVGDNKKPNQLSMDYEREIWIFEADNLAKGPVCKLTHPELSYAFTLHSAWIEEAKEQESNYHIDIRKDFSDPQSILPGVQENIKEFFEKYIYPYFPDKRDINS